MSDNQAPSSAPPPATSKLSGFALSSFAAMDAKQDTPFNLLSESNEDRFFSRSKQMPIAPTIPSDAAYSLSATAPPPLVSIAEDPLAVNTDVQQQNVSSIALPPTPNDGPTTIVNERLKSNLMMLSSCLQFEYAEVWMENSNPSLDTKDPDKFTYSNILECLKVSTSLGTGPQSLKSNEQKDSEYNIMQIVCRKAMNGGQVVWPSTSDKKCGLRMEGSDVFQTAVALPLCSIGENNLIVVLFKKEEIACPDSETLGILKMFSDCVTKPELSSFFPVATQLTIDMVAEREHRETLEEVLAKALEMQCQNASFKAPDDSKKPVSDQPSTRSGSQTARKSFDEYLSDIKRASFSRNSQEEKPATQAAEVPNIEPPVKKTRGSLAEDSVDQPTTKKDTIGFAMELFSAPHLEECMESVFRFSKTSFDLGKASWAINKNGTKIDSKFSADSAGVSLYNSFAEGFLASTSFDAAELWNDVDGTFERVACAVSNQDGMLEDIFRESKNADGTQNPNNMQSAVVFKQISVWETGLYTGNQTGNIKELCGSETFLQVKKAKQHGYETILAIPIWRHACLASPCIFFAYSKKRMGTSELCLNFVKSALARICNRNNKLGLVDVIISSSSESGGSSGSFHEMKQEGDLQQSNSLGYQQFQQFHDVQQQIQGQMPQQVPLQLQPQQLQQQQQQQQQIYQQYHQPLYPPQQHPQMQQTQPPFQNSSMAPPTFYISQPNGQLVPVPQHYLHMMQRSYASGAAPPGTQQPVYPHIPPLQAGENIFPHHQLPPTLDHYQQPQPERAKPQRAKSKAKDVTRKKTKKVASASSAPAKAKKPSASKKKPKSRKPCRMEGCEEIAASRTPYCKNHCGARTCEKEGCTKCAQGRTRFCIAHGGGRRCTFPGCKRGSRDKFFCAAHGGGRRCNVEGCSKSAVGGFSFCTSHGGGKRCIFEGCQKSAQSSTNYCVRHGGGKKCKFEGCGKVARGKLNCCMSHSLQLQQEMGGNVCQPVETEGEKAVAG